MCRPRSRCRLRHSLIRRLLQTKTVGTHIEHIYAKIGASNRSVATLFAMQHGLV
jgi:DNA-binding CsgD family transcriptional regulator